MNDNKTSWGKEAGWYDSLLAMDSTYQKDVILPNMIRLMDIKTSDHILDVACGQGFFSKAFAERGAEVMGTDISRELIKLAQQKMGPREKYMILPADKLTGNIVPKTYDKACIILALQNIENYQEVVSEIARALKSGGKFYLILNHPAFRIPKLTSWGWDEDNKVQFRRVDGYLSESKAEIDMHPGHTNRQSPGRTGGNKNSITYSFHRPLQLYFKALAKSDFVITRLEEWNSQKKSLPGPRQKAEDQSRKEIPMFMMIECSKI